LDNLICNNMKKILYILLVIVAALGIVSCGARKNTTAPPKYSSQTIARLSKQYGVYLTQADNISLYNAGSSWLGVKYRYGGNAKTGVDCSGLVGNLYRQVYGIKLERSTANILKKNCATVNRNNLREGDLVFFRTSSLSKAPSHVGIYLKNGKFIHSSSSKGVIVSSLSEPYFVRNWFTGGRVKR